MKKLFAILLSLTLLFSLTACAGTQQADSSSSEEQTSSQTADPTDMNVYALKGPTGMGMVKLMSDAGAGTAANNYTFTLASTADEIVSAIASGSADIAACPVNLASTLYKKTDGAVEILAVNTLGILYLVENGVAVSSVADLKGQTIYASGQGTSAEYVLNYILAQNGLTVGTDVTVEYVSEHSELATLAASGDVSLAVLPEPFVTSAMAQNADLSIALNLTDEWNKVSDSQLAMGCIIARKGFLEENTGAVNNFLKEYGESVAYVNSNPSEAASLIASEGILASAAIAEKAIPNCNITFITGDEMKTITQSNLQVLFDANPSSVGGELPDEGFYYTGFAD